MKALQNRPIIKHLFAETHEYEFSKIIHILQNFSLYSIAPMQNVRGHFTNPVSNKTTTPHVYFRGSVSYRTANADVNLIEIKKNLSTKLPASQLQQQNTQQIQTLSNLKFVVWTNFFGIAGVQGPLALIYTERIFKSSRAGNAAFASFLDIFNNRLISLFYKTSSCLPGLAVHEPHKSDIGQLLQAFGGMLCETDVAPPIKSQNEHDRWLYGLYLITYKSMFWQRVRSTQNLKQILQDFLRCKVEISEFCGAYFRLPPEDTTIIGAHAGNLVTLGQDTAIGNLVWRQNVSIKITIFAMNMNKYQEFNPHKNGEQLRHLRNLCEMYVPTLIKWQYVVVLNDENKLGIILGGRQNLGFDTWLAIKR
jgi:type VI secretion system protein ImpH